MIEWFARNPVAANLLLIAIVAAGLFTLENKIPLEVFPSFEVDVVTITTAVRGATPLAVEDSITSRIEDAVADLPGIKRITSRSAENVSSVSVEVLDSYDSQILLNDIKLRVDSIAALPGDAERPVITLVDTTSSIISVVASGALSEQQLRQLGETLRAEMVQLPGVAKVEFAGVRNPEITVEVEPDVLRAYNFTLQQIGQAIQAGSIDVSAGNILTRNTDLLIRTDRQAYSTDEFARIPVLSTRDGVTVRLGDIATIRDDFEGTGLRTLMNGRPAVSMDIYPELNASAIEVATVVKKYVVERQQQLSTGIFLDYWLDDSEVVKSRLRTLTNSAIQGGILVVLVLAIFLRPAVAFWVCLGIPVCFIGSFIFMDLLGVTLNIITLFAFIVVLGIVVDDAIVTGENVYRHMQFETDTLTAAINGTKEVAVPVTFGILTTVAAFLPMAFIEGARGAIFAQIPAVVIPILLLSLVESKLILPAHLRHVRLHQGEGHSSLNRLANWQRNVSRKLETSIIRYYQPILARCIQHPYLTLIVALSISSVIVAFALSGWLRFNFFPRVSSEIIVASLDMPAATAYNVTDQYVQHITEQAEKIREKYRDPDTGESLVQHVFSLSGGTSRSTAANFGRIYVQLLRPEQRSTPIQVREVIQEWQTLIGPIPGAERLSFWAELGRSGDPIDIQLTGVDLDVMKQIVESTKQRLGEFAGLYDIKDNLGDGKEEIKIDLAPQGLASGLSLAGLSQQIRHAFYGYESQRIQRGREEVRVVVTLPETARDSIQDLQNLTIQFNQADGQRAQVPLDTIVDLEFEQSPTALNRIDRARTVNISADLDKRTTDVEAVKRELKSYLDQLLTNYPNVSYSLEGEAREQNEMFTSIISGTLFVLCAVYILLAIPFKSYIQPFIVMSIIPLGVVGAILGHIVVFYSLSIISILGLVALIGVVINDSLVLVDYINQQRHKGASVEEAILTAGAARFRPVMLTSLTTFAGLMPLLLESSTQAQFLKPMAISLGFGILFATAITLIIVPVNYQVYSQLSLAADRFKKASRRTAPKPLS